MKLDIDLVSVFDNTIVDPFVEVYTTLIGGTVCEKIVRVPIHAKLEYTRHIYLIGNPIVTSLHTPNRDSGTLQESEHHHNR